MDGGVTIAAIATPPGEGAIGIIRLSGTEAPLILSRIFRSKLSIAQFDSHKFYLGTLIGNSGTALDQAMAVWMKAPHSFTGEDCVELHCHGGQKLLETILALILGQGARHARPGEFSERAFLNGKIDLTQAEAICDLIKAKSDKALAQSFQNLSGHLSRVIEDLKTEIIATKAHLEASIDFPDEDITPDGVARLCERLTVIHQGIRRLIASYERGRILREGVRVAIMGKPNVGKSSLLNTLLGEDRAIVHESAGTTRDFIEETLVLGGIPIRLIDTAGLRGASDAVEAEGIRRAHALLAHADLVLALFDGSQPLDVEDQSAMDVLKEKVANEKILWIKTKSDLPSQWDSITLSLPHGEETISLSIHNKNSIKALETAIITHTLESAMQDSESATITHLRHRDGLSLADRALENALSSLYSGASFEYAASDLVQAIDALKEITGEITHDDVLDKLFREFCIGK